MGIKSWLLDVYWHVRERRWHDVLVPIEQRRHRVAHTDATLNSAIDRFSESVNTQRVEAAYKRIVR